tara:strand:- start:30049 stop:30603 length:555 start_codon:yes stop_codon:yes gene_type:complete
MKIIFYQVPKERISSVHTSVPYDIVYEHKQHYLIFDEDRMTCIIMKNNKNWQYKIVEDKKPKSVIEDEARVFESGAKRDSNSNKPYIHNLRPYTRLRFGYHMTLGAFKYGDNNWLLGMPTDQYLESVDRHLALYMSGDTSEDHLSAIIFGIQGCMINEEKEGIQANHYFEKLKKTAVKAESANI